MEKIAAGSVCEVSIEEKGNDVYLRQRPDDVIRVKGEDVYELIEKLKNIVESWE